VDYRRHEQEQLIEDTSPESLKSKSIKSPGLIDDSPWKIKQLTTVKSNKKDGIGLRKEKSLNVYKLEELAIKLKN
jgi:hypothetical protein